MPLGESPRVRNSVTVDSPYGLRSLTLVVGDITRATNRVLVVPTHANTEFPVEGEVLQAVVHRFGVGFSSLEPLPVPEAGFGTFRVCDLGQFPGREILLVRIPGPYSVEVAGGRPIDVYGEALWTLFGSLAALELRRDELKSLALPLLAGTRGYEIGDLMRAILEKSLDWLKASRYMNAVNFYVVDQAHIDEWAAAMDDVLGRKFVDTARNELIQALRDEILARPQARQFGSLTPGMQLCLDSFRDILRQERIPLDQVAVAARKLVECLVETLLKEEGVLQPKGDLADQIGQLRSGGRTAPWIVSHFHCLRTLGNSGAHWSAKVSYRPPSLRDEDLIAILASVQRVLEFASTRD